MTRSITTQKLWTARRWVALPVLAACLTTLAIACTTQGSDEPSPSAEAAGQAALEAARDAVPLAVKAVAGQDVRAEAAWTSCMPGQSWRYAGAGVFEAPRSGVVSHIDAIRGALVNAGFEDVTQVDNQVAVERDDITLAFSPHPATASPKAWQFSFRTECLPLSGADRDRAEADTPTPVAGLE